MVDDVAFFDFYYQPFWQKTTFKITLIAAILCVILLIVYLYKKFKKKEIMPWEWAEEEFAKLSLETCQSKEDFKKFYFDLTRVIKQYLHKRYGWNTEGKTDGELASFLAYKSFEQSLTSDLKKMFKGATWIKFAGESTIKTQAEGDLLLIKNIIQKTIPYQQKNKS